MLIEMYCQISNSYSKIIGLKIKAMKKENGANQKSNNLPSKTKQNDINPKKLEDPIQYEEQNSIKLRMNPQPFKKTDK
jgi:hypothetical protein